MPLTGVHVALLSAIMEDILMFLPMNKLHPCALDPTLSDIADLHQQVFPLDWIIPISVTTHYNFPHLSELLINQSIEFLYCYCSAKFFVLSLTG